MKIRKLQLAIMAASLAVAMSASASITYSGIALSGLDYVVGNPDYNPQSDTQYVPASGSTPALAALYTSDAGPGDYGDNPGVFVLGPLGTLSSFSASYHLYSSSGAAAPGNDYGTQPYWVLKLNTPGVGGPVVIVGMGGSTLDSSSAIHVWHADQSYWDQSLGSILNYTYNGVAYGDMTVDSAGVEIGFWNIPDTIGATANFDSITVSTAPVPEPTTMIAGALLLLPFGASTIRMLRKNRKA